MPRRMCRKVGCGSRGRGRNRVIECVGTLKGATIGVGHHDPRCCGLVGGLFSACLKRLPRGFACGKGRCAPGSFTRDLNLGVSSCVRLADFARGPCCRGFSPRMPSG